MDRSMIAIGTWRKLSRSAGKFREEWGIPGEKDAKQMNDFSLRLNSFLIFSPFPPVLDGHR